MSGFAQFAEDVALTKRALQEILQSAEVDKNSVTGFCFQGITTCAIFVALADSEAHFREPIGDVFGIDKAKGIEYRPQGAKLLGV